MTFTPINVTNGSTPANATWGNNAQTQYSEAINSFNQDLFTPFVLSGLVATKDGSINNQLDVTAGVAYLLQTDSTTRRRAPVSSTQTTSVASTTYYLFLNNDGTWTWGTSSSGPSHSLAICQVTTDGSGNIAIVTDVRNFSTTFLSGYANFTNPPTITFPASVQVATLGGVFDWHGTLGGSNQRILHIHPTDAGAVDYGFNYNTDFSLNIFNYTDSLYVFKLTRAGAVTFAGSIASLGGQASTGSFGAPVIVAQTLRQHVTATTNQQIVNYTPSVAGVYRVSVYFALNNGTSGNKITLSMQSTDPDTSSTVTQFLEVNAGTNTVLGGANSIANFNYSALGMPIAVKASTAIIVNYQDPTNTPNDYVTAIIERLA